MHVPTLTSAGLLPLGRFGCTVPELETRFVTAAEYAQSVTRGDIFEDFIAVKGVFESYSPSLVESIWVGGSFTTSKIDPSDIDCLFILNEAAFVALPSNTKRARVMQLGVKDYVKNKLALDVESFVLVRSVIANPWESHGISREAAKYTEVRGAWDDWWLRTRTSTDPTAPPTAADAEPIRGYLEVKP